ncbi:hypothetical protein [Endozoicomonas ascidiicola]|uniref:hypothetical protein n=1 Tax=Endozoicomonas ascidiicola TaxID=1698521 RepID=UPI000A4F31EB|nr:hypothetical protein [Endozoicomonas ascidiicola]
MTRFIHLEHEDFGIVTFIVTLSRSSESVYIGAANLMANLDYVDPARTLAIHCHSTLRFSGADGVVTGISGRDVKRLIYFSHNAKAQLLRAWLFDYAVPHAALVAHRMSSKTITMPEKGAGTLHSICAGVKQTAR